MFNKYEYDPVLAKELWSNFVQGQPADLSYLPSDIRESWIRSRQRNIDPQKTIIYRMLPRENLQKNHSYTFVVENFDLLESFVKVATINDLKIHIYDADEQAIFSILGNDYFHVELGEEEIGTNAVPLAMASKRPVVVLKHQHYLRELNDFNCIAAPIFGSDGRPMGSVFCTFQQDELLALVYSIVVAMAHVLNSYLRYRLDSMKYAEQMRENPDYPNQRASQVATYTFKNIIGTTPQILAIKEMAKNIAHTNLPVLILGESGTGKEVLAQAIHNESARRKGPFVAINCGALPENLVESELFGYEPGAFTGALKGGKKGQLEIASTGTVFLDEIESMPLYVQVKLLRVLSTGKIMKIGGDRETPVNIRVISASKKDLLMESDKERFREDLFYRISTVQIKLPPLRNRAEDMPHLVEYILRNIAMERRSDACRIDPEMIPVLSSFHWRGNIRELENVLQLASLKVSPGEALTAQHLPGEILENFQLIKAMDLLESVDTEGESAGGLLKKTEEIVIKKVLQENHFQIEKSAAILGINRKSLYNKIQRNPELTEGKNRKE